jgi:hypothetical protein
MIGTLRIALANNFRKELNRKLEEEPSGRVVQFIANEADNQ